MNDRPCEECVYHTEMGCSKWECEPLKIGDALARAYDDGYAQGKAETEAYLLHCGDVTPVTNADRIRAMTDEELAEWINKHDYHTSRYGYYPEEAILDWLKQEVDDDSK